MLLIVLLVIFTGSMFLWLLSNLGSLPTVNSNWLALFAVLVLGVVVFLLGSGAAVWPR